MTKILDMWVPAPIPGRVYLEMEDETIKYGFAPAGIELSIFETPVVRYSHGEMDIWLTGNEHLGARIGLRKISGNRALVKLQVFFPKPGTNRKTIWEEWVSW
ncbi:MAG: hypothetical protein AB1607_18120 [Chloroflexota bacterium]